MHFPPRRSSSNAVPLRAFTLIELLVVISIIAVLAGLLLPVGQRVIENGKRVSAKSTMTQIVAAVKNYQSDYGIYPVVPPTDTTTPAMDLTYDTNAASSNKYGGHNHILLDVLRAQNLVAVNPSADPTTANLNARRTVYFEYKDAKSTTSPIDGFVQATPAGASGGGGTTPKDASGTTVNPGDLMDNWGNLYRVRVDAGYTDKVADPFENSSSQSDDSTVDSKNVHTAVISWAIGAQHLQWDHTNAAAGTFEASGNVATWK